MSRIGKQPIVIPSGVDVTVSGSSVVVKGPKGTLTQTTHPHALVAVQDGQVVVTMTALEDKQDQSLWGTTRALVQNMVQGVTVGFKKVLEVNGVGYKVAVAGPILKLDLGYSHQVEYRLPDGVTAEVAKNVITLMGADKQSVGQTAAEIRKLRKPEPYKGKGIKYMEEVIRRKAGKAAKSA